MNNQKFPFLPYGKQSISEDDINNVCSVLRSKYLTTGPLTEAFELELAKRTNSKYAITCSSGTAALHLAALVAGLGSGDWSIVPSMTFVSTANASRFTGADVYFSDVNAETGLIEVSNLNNALNKKLNFKALFVVHMNGQTTNISELYKIAKDNNLIVIEDGCHALGTEYQVNNQTYKVGQCAHSDMTIFSFHPVKTIVMGEGGAITTNNQAMADKLRLLRNHGISRHHDDIRNKQLAFNSSDSVNPWYYEMQALGFNYRASDIHCALGLSQLKRLEEFSSQRHVLMKLYDERLKDLAPCILPIKRVDNCNPVLHLYPVMIDFENIKIDRSIIMQRLYDKNIGTQVHYIPVHYQPYYEKLYGPNNLKGAERYYSRVLSLPFYVDMTKENIDYVIENLAKVIKS